MEQLVIKIFLELVKIYSPSYHEKKVCDYVVEYLKKINLKPQVDQFGNVYASVSGFGRPIILSAHMDTVEPCNNVKPVIKDGVIYSDGTTILGADDKAGIASILSLLTKLQSENSNRRSLEVIFTVEEEINCGGAQKLNYKLIKGKEAIVLDRSASVNSITLSTPYADKVKIKVEGKSTHSRSPEDGIHAITAFADFALSVKYGRRNKNTVSNIGVVKGGSATNVIPNFLDADGEIRSLDRVNFNKEKNFWLQVAKKVSIKYGAKISLEFKTMLAGFKINKKDKFIVDLSEAVRRAGFRPEYVTALGGSDANIFNQHGITAVPLGQGREGAHSLKEAMPIQAFLDTENILLSLIKK